MQEMKFEELAEDIRNDLLGAEEATKKTFPRDRDVRIGVILAADGKRFEGANIVRERFTGSTCAERMALDKALFEGIEKIERIVIIGMNSQHPFEEVASPCGNCRQILFDTLDDLGQEDIEIYLSNSDKSKIVKTNLRELLPLAYKSSRNNV
jgi:cytidine deaminase